MQEIARNLRWGNLWVYDGQKVRFPPTELPAWPPRRCDTVLVLLQRCTHGSWLSCVKRSCAVRASLTCRCETADSVLGGFRCAGSPGHPRRGRGVPHQRAQRRAREVLQRDHQKGALQRTLQGAVRPPLEGRAARPGTCAHCFAFSRTPRLGAPLQTHQLLVAAPIEDCVRRGGPLPQDAIQLLDTARPYPCLDGCSLLRSCSSFSFGHPSPSRGGSPCSHVLLPPHRP